MIKLHFSIIKGKGNKQRRKKGRDKILKVNYTELHSKFWSKINCYVRKNPQVK